MTIRKNTVSRLLAAVGMTAVVVVGAVSPSLAASTKHVHHARTYDARAYDARASAAVPRSVRQQPNTGSYMRYESMHGTGDGSMAY